MGVFFVRVMFTSLLSGFPLLVCGHVDGDVLLDGGSIFLHLIVVLLRWSLVMVAFMFPTCYIYVARVRYDFFHHERERGKGKGR